MKVYFIGAGPGAPDLITVRGLNLIKTCPVCLYAGSLVPAELIAQIPSTVKLINTADLKLDQIIAEFAGAKEMGKDVARLHSGDPSLYGAIAEQMRALDERAIDYEIVPGVPAFAAAAAAMKQELTLPGLNQSLIITRTAVHSSAMPADETLHNLGQAHATMAIHLSVKNIDCIQKELIPLYGTDCPVVVAARISWPDEIILRGTLADIDQKIASAGLRKTAIIFIGKGMSPDNFNNSSLYSLCDKK
ncbi:precorrin-4 C(11)-methyltransferase [Bartonella sp. LJL80]